MANLSQINSFLGALHCRKVASYSPSNTCCA